MRTEIEALKEIRDRISYFCSRTDGKYDPPWAQEVIGIIDDVLITPYRRCKRFSAPFYVEVGTSIVAIRCASNHDVVWRADHSVHGKATVDWAESVCTRMNQEAHIRELSKNVSKNGADFGQLGDAAKLREALEKVRDSFYVNDYGDYQVECGDKVSDLVDAALAAQPRNCDRFQTKDAAREAFQKLRHHRVWADVSLWDDKDEIEAFLDWLFATGKEVGNNADK